MVSRKLSVPFWTLSGVGALYAVFVGLLTNPVLQRHALYANKLHTAFWNDISKPESFGFAPRQVTPLNITTADGETLFAWHVLPLGLYAQHQAALISQPADTPFSDSLSLKLLTDDPAARLVISFHGNAGHIAEGQRPATLRALAGLPPILASPAAASASSSANHDPAALVNAHILTFDYRGFGASTGSPSETGLITDALAVLTCARTVLGVPAARTVLLGTSLGTAVVAGVMDALVNATTPATTVPGTQLALALAQAPVIPADAQFAGLVITSGFDALPNLLKTYAIGGVLPILSPLAGYPRLQAWLTDKLADTWMSAERWARVVAHFARGEARGQPLRVHIMHARDDFEIKWQHSDLLYAGCVRGLGGEEAAAAARREVSARLSAREGWKGGPRGSGESGRFERRRGAGVVEVRQTVVEWGGHNHLVASTPVVLAVWEMLGGGG